MDHTAMSSLELLIPPPLVALVVGAAMWGASLRAPAASVVSLRLPLAIAIAMVGLAFSISGRMAFRRARTSANPFKPQAASSLVVTGIYRLTRNPMYVGLALVLVGWAVFLWSGWSLLGPVVFVAYIARFQIEAEERALARLFGDGYSAYKSKVRRWL
jgi:protein-S-isoprenylcysteine O-methyltransferase Ste14